MKTLHRLLVLGIVLLALLLLVTPAFAQDKAPELPAIPVMPVEEAASLLLATLVTILVGLVDSPITTGLVALLKRVAVLNAVPANILQFVIAGGIAALWWGSSALGYGPQFQSVYAFLWTLIPALAGLLARQAASAAVYDVARNKNLGVFGYQRAPTVEEYLEQRFGKAAKPPASQNLLG